MCTLQMTSVPAAPYVSYGRHRKDEIKVSAEAEIVDLESRGLSTFDVSAVRFSHTCSNITQLKLNYNSLSCLPSDFSAVLPALQVLSVCGNDIKYLPSYIGQFKELRSLSANENELSALPDSLFQLPRLCELHLLGNRLKHIQPDISQLKSLRTLTLEDNHVVELPSTFGELENLEVLEASENNLEHLPRNIGKLVNLSILNLSRNKLLELPDSFGDLPSLRFVDVSNNFLPELTPRMESAGTCLQKFSASDNLLKRFPPWMNTLAHIREIHMGNNYIDDELPDDFGAVIGSSLKHVDLRANYLKHLPSTVGHLSQVETLHFGSHILEIERRGFQNGNCLTRLPDSFGRLFNLRHLRLDENQLGSLPESFGDLRNLEYLDLGLNILRQLPASFSKLTSLKTCSLSKNCIQYLPDDFGALRALERLRLDTNQLRDLPASFCQLVSLQTLNLVDNLLSEFPSCLNELTSLVRVALDDNNFEIDIPEVSRLDVQAKYPKDGIHRFVKTAASHSEEQTDQMTTALVLALKKGDSIWRSHTAAPQRETEGSEDIHIDSESDRGTTEYGSDVDVSLSSGGGSVPGTEFIDHDAEPENWDMEIDDRDDDPFSCDTPFVYSHPAARKSPVGRNVLDFLYVPSDVHPSALPIPDTEFAMEDGQFDDAD